MINEKELRTGNLYTTIRNQEVLVTGIDTVNKFVTINSTGNADINSKGDNSVIFEDLSPIEITPKSISQFGFAPDESLALTVVSDNQIKFTWSEKLNQLVLVDSLGGLIGQEITHIHQLQNLYFFLTGKELPLQ